MNANYVLPANRKAMPPIGTPAAEIAIDVALVRSLLKSQHPDLATLSIQPFESGWDNALFLLGDAMVVRIPRRAMAAELIANEQRWLPLLQKQLPISIPAPLRIGLPTASYPWKWSVVPLLPGQSADEAELDDDAAAQLADFLVNLHTRAPDNAPRNPVRGVALATREEVMRERFARLHGKTGLLTPNLMHAWEQALSAPIDVEPSWIHGDMHARNVLVQDGRLSAVIDWGDLAQGDRATDLASIWMLLGDRDARRKAMSNYGMASEATWRRAKGWAVLFGVTLLDTGLVDNSRHARMGEQTLQRITGGP